MKNINKSNLFIRAARLYKVAAECARANEKETTQYNNAVQEYERIYERIEDADMTSEFLGFLMECPGITFGEM